MKLWLQQLLRVKDLIVAFRVNDPVMTKDIQKVNDLIMTEDTGKIT